MAVKLQDENFGNDIIDAMTMHLIASSDELWLEKFLPEFLQSNGEGSMGRKLVVDWFVWSALVFDVKAESLLTRIQDLDFYGEVVVAILKKNEAEWESDAQPPYCKCPCCYHTHTENGGQLCGGVTKVEKVEV